VLVGAWKLANTLAPSWQRSHVKALESAPQLSQINPVFCARPIVTSSGIPSAV
jgi:hypothetical protein